MVTHVRGNLPQEVVTRFRRLASVVITDVNRRKDEKSTYKRFLSFEPFKKVNNMGNVLRLTNRTGCRR